jgi:ATPases with chaperone activity, ATP-binding subunit
MILYLQGLRGLVDMKVTICYGPLSWFSTIRPEMGKNDQFFLNIVRIMDDQRKFQTQSDCSLKFRTVIAESSDYASLKEHAITNFIDLVFSFEAESVYLHNPPNVIYRQFERYPNIDLQVKYYKYPTITKNTLIKFRNDFNEHVVGQKKVKQNVLTALYPLTRQRRSKPIVIMFYGPSGVGKTETAKFVNDILGGELLRKQFSMFQGGDFSSYLFGGTHSEASFAHDLLDRESGVILIDEFDKANPVFHSAFYEFFDEGIFEDKNYKVQLGPAVIICTSNYKNEDEIRRTLGDALYSRFDRFIEFECLSKEEVEQVVDRLTEKFYNQLDNEEKRKLPLSKVKEQTCKIPANINQVNVRKIGKLVEEIISLLLIRLMLKDD